MGVGVPAPLPYGEENYDIERRVVAAGQGRLGYTVTDLRELARADAHYRNLCSKLKKTTEAPAPTEKTILQAEREAKKAFLRWQNLRYHRVVRKRDVEEMENQLYLRMTRIAHNAASRSIRRIQAVLGMSNIGAQKIPEFQDKRLGRPLSQAAEIARILREPLVSPGTALASE